MTARTSAFKGTWTPNARPYLTLTADCFVSLQGDTSVIACGECRRNVDFNRYITTVSTEAAVDAPPGSASFTMSVPDNDVNDFFIDGQFIIIPMMEVEIFAKGYFTVGGIPQYYKIFWGLVSSVSKSWSGGVTTIQISCKDILRWWELTNVILNPAYLNSFGSSGGNWNMFQNQFAGMNPYTVIIQLAKESMGDFSLTAGSQTSFAPETGPEGPVIASYAKDIMTYWQLKFANIWNSLVLYGSSGKSYTFSGSALTAAASAISQEVVTGIESEQAKLGDAAGASTAVNDAAFKVHVSQLAAYKTELARAGDVDFYQNETQSKLAIAQTARDQAGYEFYCDTTGDIIFKPPFYNLNVLPNKPVSWIQDFEIIDDSVTDSEAEVFTHIVSSGNAFTGGAFDAGLNDDICTPRTGVYDYHLLRRYGWRRLDYQCEWASNPRQLFFHLIDYLDRVNSKRQYGSVTIPMRPELRMGFPIWFPRYDSFFYIQGISHNYSPGGQATTVLTLTAKRSKFIAPSNIGTIIQNKNTTSSDAKTDPGTQVKAKATKKSSKAAAQKVPQTSYTVSFPQDPGETTGTVQNAKNGQPQMIRDPKTGKLLGFPNAVMVYQKPFDGDLLAKLNLSTSPSKETAKKAAAVKKGSVTGAVKKETNKLNFDGVQGEVARQLSGERRAMSIKRLRAHRYESGMTNAGAYDYAHDVGGYFQEITLVPIDLVTWSDGTTDPSAQGYGSGENFQQRSDALHKQYDEKILIQTKISNDSNATTTALFKRLTKAKSDYNTALKKLKKVKSDQEIPPELQPLKSYVDTAQAQYDAANAISDANKKSLADMKSSVGGLKKAANLNMLVRPVSDEFGFELIGHYRYGRGSFIDRGKIQIGNPDANGAVANKLNIQFASTGGLLTDSTGINSAGPNAAGFSSAYEDMRPDDYLTGASFDHGVAGNGEVTNQSFTSQTTYDNAITAARQRTGTVIFADADATRRGQTLAELKPTMDDFGLSGGIEKCGCQLGKTDWLSVLPQSALDQILRPRATVATNTTTSSDLDPNATSASALQNGTTTLQNAVVTPTSITSSDGADFNNPVGEKQSVNFGGFFDVLNAYLVNRFNTDYNSGDGNAERENADTGASLGIATQVYQDDTNLLGDPQDPLFNAASNGDPLALEKLQKRANFNFGDAKEVTKNAGKLITDAADQAKFAIVSLPEQEKSSGRIFSVDTNTPAQQAVVDANKSVQQAQTNLVAAEQFLRSNPNSSVAQQGMKDAQTQYATAQAALATAQGTSSRSNDVNAALSQVNAAQDDYNHIQSLIQLYPSDKSLVLQLQQAQVTLTNAQNNLTSAQNELVDGKPPPQYQPPVNPPTQTSVLNPTQFGTGLGSYRNGDPFPDGP